ncbi:MAG: hypothetical protein Q4B04_00315 [bacterium]|nr:hypothetical protein [bacterium]
MRLNSAVLKRNIFKVLSAALTMALIVGLFCFPTTTVSAAEFNETNPDLTLVNINSNLEVNYGTPGYDCSGSLKNASANNGTYELSSNAFCVWDTNDDVTFAYKEFPVAGTDNDNFTMEATILDYYPKDQLHSDAGAGLMIRTGLGPNDPEVMFHVRPDNRLMLVYRTSKDGATTASYVEFDVKYPIRLRITKVGQKIGFAYLLKGSSKMVEMALKLKIRSDGPLYAGFANYSRNKAVTSTMCFEELTFSGFGTADGTVVPDSPGDNVEDPDKDVVFEEELPMTDDVLFYESFTDRSILTGKEEKNNPIWDGPYEANIITLKEKREGIEYGNRVWFMDFDEDNFYAGNEKMSDYIASMDFMFTAADNASQAVVKLAVRNMKNELYGISNYSAVLSGRNKLALYYKNQATNGITANGYELGSVTVDDYADGQWHTLSVKVVDNIIRVSFDDKKDLIRHNFVEIGSSVKIGTNPRVLGRGNIGIATFESSVYLDNIIVKAVKDPFGTHSHPDYGTLDYDNYIGGNWNENIPQHIVDWIDMGRYYDGLVTG